MKNINENILTIRWLERYSQLSDKVKNKIDLYENNVKQLKVIKKNRKYPEVGDIFKLISGDNLEINGVVINNHINNINGDDLLVIALFKYKYEYSKVIKEGISLNNLLLPPQIVGKEYWSEGFFNNIDHYNNINCDNYGFYSVGKQKIYDEYGNEIYNEPELLGAFGVATIIGISMKINQELIISEII